MEKKFFEGKHPLEELMINYQNQSRKYEEKGFKIPANFYKKCGDIESYLFYKHAKECVNRCIYDINRYNHNQLFNKGGVKK